MPRRPRGASWSEEYRARVERRQAEGFSRTQARGHPGRTELPIREQKAIERDLLGARRQYIVEAPVITKRDGKGRPVERETKTIIVTINEAGKMKTHAIPLEKREGLLKTIERRNRLRKRRRRAPGAPPGPTLPPIPLPEEGTP